ncbi:hypothetical protein TALC_00709 [Thermoplasmatales archaeon BRNA1]|nr:hypothetical protein TALC_00709 [Thermoplasmatales archaeon BRNA1]
MSGEDQNFSSEQNSDGVRESQQYVDVQSAEYNNLRDFRADSYTEDQIAGRPMRSTTVSSSSPQRNMEPEVDGNDIVNSMSSSASTGATTGASTTAATTTAATSTAATTAAASTAATVGTVATTFVALVVVSSVIVPAVTDADVSVDFSKLVSGSDFIGYEIYISDFEGENIRIVLMDGLNEVYSVEAMNGENSGSIDNLKPGNSYVLEVRSGTPALYVLASKEIATLAAGKDLSLSFEYRPGLSLINYFLEVEDFEEYTGLVLSAFSENGTELLNEAMTEPTSSGQITGLAPGSKCYFSITDGTDTLWSEMVSTSGPPATVATITQCAGANYVAYSGTINGFYTGDNVTVRVTDLSGTVIDEFSVVTAEIEKKIVSGLSPETGYRLYVVCTVNGTDYSLLDSDYVEFETSGMESQSGYTTINYRLDYVPDGETSVSVSSMGQTVFSSGDLNGWIYDLEPSGTYTFTFTDGGNTVYTTDVDTVNLEESEVTLTVSGHTSSSITYSVNAPDYLAGDNVQVLVNELIGSVSTYEQTVESCIFNLNSPTVTNHTAVGLNPGTTYRLHVVYEYQGEPGDLLANEYEEVSTDPMSFNSTSGLTSINYSLSYTPTSAASVVVTNGNGDPVDATMPSNVYGGTVTGLEPITSYTFHLYDGADEVGQWTASTFDYTQQPSELDVSYEGGSDDVTIGGTVNGFMDGDVVRVKIFSYSDTTGQEEFVDEFTVTSESFSQDLVLGGDLYRVYIKLISNGDEIDLMDSQSPYYEFTNQA